MESGARKTKATMQVDIDKISISLVYLKQFVVEGAEIMFKNVDGGVQIDYSGLTLDLLINKETTTTEWTDGEEMKTYTWKTGPNSVRIRNSVAAIGVEEIQDITFLPAGVSVSFKHKS